jgi:hypothetical protein
MEPQQSAQRLSQLIQNRFTQAARTLLVKEAMLLAPSISIEMPATWQVVRLPSSSIPTFLDSMRLELGNPARLVEANGQLYDTRQLSGKANHRIETNRLRDSTTGGLEMLQAALSSANRLPLHLEISARSSANRLPLHLERAYLWTGPEWSRV